MKYKLISDEIIKMRELDLEVRQRLLEEGKLNEGYNEEMEKIHIKNANRLQEIIKEIGYPNKQKVGIEGSESAWLIIQHAISLPKFMINCLELVKDELKNGEINPQNYAFLKDRISMYQDLPQSYGTQFETDENGKLKPYLLEESRQIINERRKLLGLNTIEERLHELEQEDEKYFLNNKTKEKIKQEQLDYNEWRMKVGWIKQK